MYSRVLWIGAATLLLGLCDPLILPASGQGKFAPASGNLIAAEAEPFLFLTDHSFPSATRFRNDLVSLNRLLEKELGLPLVQNKVYVHIFENGSAFRNMVLQTMPQLSYRDARRKAIFLLREGTPYIFVHSSNELHKSLRHEFTHVVLNTAIPDAPIWLDEGLAQFCENDKSDGWQTPLATLLWNQVQAGWRPNLAHLEGVGAMQQMDHMNYAEAWSWVHVLVNGSPQSRQIIRQYLADLRDNRAATGSLAERIRMTLGDPEQLWFAHFGWQPPPPRPVLDLFTPVRLRLIRQ